MTHGGCQSERVDPVELAAFAVGAVIVSYTAFAAFRTVVLPRAASTMINRVVFIGTRKLFDLLAHERRGYAARDRVLAVYGPLCLVLLPFVWIGLMVTGFSLMMWAFGVEPLRQAFILSGSSVFTLGFAAPDSLPVDVLVFLEAFLGLGLVALVISYLPSIYGAFARREQLVGLLDGARRESPVSGGDAHEVSASRRPRAHRQRTLPALGAVVQRRRGESYLVRRPRLLPLTAARAFVDRRGGLRARHRLAADLDGRSAAAGSTQLCLRTGFFCLRRIADYFGIRYDPHPRPDDAISVTRGEFDAVCVELSAAGVPLKADLDQAWRDFAGWRVNYDAVLVQLAALVYSPPAMWSSDRGYAAPKPKLFRRSSRAA